MIVDLLQHIINALSVGSTYALLALGLTLVFSVMGFMNFAYGMLLVAAAYVAMVFGNWGTPAIVTVIAVILAATVFSVLIGRIAFQPFIDAPPVTLLVSSFAVAQALQSVALFGFSARAKPIATPEFLEDVVDIAGLQVPVLQLVTVASGIVVVGALYLVMNRSSMGMRIRAAAEDPATSRLMGVTPERVLIAVFAISGVIAGVVALLWFGQVSAVTPMSDLDPLVMAFIAVILGGLGNPKGAIVGGLALGAIEVAMTVILPSGALTYKTAIVFTLIIAMLLLRPRGLVGEEVVEGR